MPRPLVRSAAGPLASLETKPTEAEGGAQKYPSLTGCKVGHYRLLEKLGAGGMGEVYLAEDLQLGRRIALKILSPEQSSSPQRLERFRREARAVAALNHPNIVTLYSVEQEDDLHFLTMELVQGKTLGRLIPPEGMPWRRLLGIAVPLACALEEAHERGIVHRDLKPENVMVSGEDRVKVLDFGIAKALSDADAEVTWKEGEAPTSDDLTRTGLILGTPRYMAPEQILGRPVDHRTDLFAFGVLLFEMATGRLPFTGRNSSEVFRSILEGAPPPLVSLRPEIPAALSDLVSCCLEKDASRRIQSTRELRERLEALVSEPSLAPAPGPLEAREPPRVSWKRPAIFAVAAVLALLLVVAAWWLLPRLQAGWADTPEVKPPVPAAEEKPASLAVLPLANLSREPEYFVDGMTEALISSLADVRGVRVISRQSVMRYKGSAKPLPEIARELGVEMIVLGSVLRAGDRVRIAAQLIRAQPEQQIWARDYERDLRDVLSLQKELAQTLGAEIKGEIEPEDRRQARRRPVDPDAYDAFLRGRHVIDGKSEGGLPRAIELFQEALGRDPGFAPAHAGLAEAYSLLGFYGSTSPLEAYRLARRHASAALELDPDSADAWASLGMIQFFADRDWEEAEKSFRRAIALHPNHASARHLYAIFLIARRRTAEGMAELRRVYELDPLSPFVCLNLGLQEMKTDAERALDLFEKARILAPDLPWTYLNFSIFYGRQGRMEPAFENLQKGLGLEFPQIVPEMEKAYAAGGRRAALEAAARSLVKLEKSRNIPPEEIARVYVMLGEHEKALDYLEASYERGFSGAVLFGANADFEWKPLLEEPRFLKLLERIETTASSGRAGRPKGTGKPDGDADLR